MPGITRGAALTALALCTAVPAAAQGVPDSVLQRQRRTIDSLAASLRILQSRVDSLSRSRIDSGTDALAALRAAARDAARDSTAAAAPSGGRSQNLLNPEISVTSDVRSALVRPGPQTETFEPREFEFSFQSALDPFSATKIFVGIGGGEVDVEEAYVYWVGLPGHLRLDVGKFRQTIGELNRWHGHALPEGEYPLVLQRFFGEEGLAQTGVSLYWPLPFSGRLGTFELTAQVTKGVNGVLFGRYGDRPGFLAQLSAFWQLSRSTYAQLSVTGIAGDGRDSTHVWPPSLPPGGWEMTEQRIETRLGAVAGRFTWRPPAEARRREVTIRGEVYALRRRVDGVGPTRLGAYVGATAKLGQRWIAGVRGDWVEPVDPTLGGREWAVTPTLTFWQSEFVYLRAQWTHHRDLFALTSDRFGIQAVWAMGPHKHELF
ncbi:MAG: hypothetical protein AAB409_00320 [Gemmatimonadota bacterium]